MFRAVFPIVPTVFRVAWQPMGSWNNKIADLFLYSLSWVSEVKKLYISTTTLIVVAPGTILMLLIGTVHVLMTASTLATITVPKL